MPASLPALPLDVRKGFTFPELSDIHRGYAAAPTDDILKTKNGGVAAKI